MGSMRASALVVAGVLAGALACFVIGIVAVGVAPSLPAANTTEDAIVTAWWVMSGLSGIAAALIAVTVSRALAIGYAAGFAGAVLVLDWIAYGMGAIFSSSDIPQWTPDLRMQIPSLVAFGVTWAVLALGDALRWRVS